jgi:hypothetical protein
MRATLLLLVAATTIAQAQPSATEPPDPADTPMFKAPTGHDFVVETPEERSTTNIAAIAGIAGAGALVGGLGLYFHLDSRSESNKVTAGVPTSRPWLPADQAAVDQASSDRTKAALCYAVGGALIIGAVVALIVTDPGSTRTVIHPHTAIAPTPGGAIAMHVWSF